MVIDALNASGADWAVGMEVKHGDPDFPAADFIAVSADGKRTLKMQHTRADHDQSFWRDGASNHHDVAGQAEELRRAVERKQKAASADITLVLDASGAMGALLEGVADSFLEQSGEWASSLGFQQIWLVGPTQSFTRRLG
jgi:hypothetical protein